MSRRHPPGCAHCAAVRRPHPADCAHCAAVAKPHPPGCAHCAVKLALGREFRLWRASAEAAREAECYGYATEEALYGPLPTFRAFLEQLRGSGSFWDNSEAAA